MKVHSASLPLPALQRWIKGVDPDTKVGGGGQIVV